MRNLIQVNDCEYEGRNQSTDIEHDDSRGPPEVCHEAEPVQEHLQHQEGKARCIKSKEPDNHCESLDLRLQQ
jgi:hypothetical protein